MIFKLGESPIRLAVRYKKFFIMENKNKNNAMLIRRRSWPPYLLNSNPQIRLYYYYFGHAGNTRIIQASMFVNKIDFRKVLEATDEPYS